MRADTDLQGTVALIDLVSPNKDTEYWLASGYFAATLAGCAFAIWAGTLAVRLLALKG